MLTSQSCQLTVNDYAILEAMEERFPRRDDLMRSILHQKLSNAVVMFREEIPPTAVTLNSRVTYRVNGGSAETRVIADDEMRGLVGMTVVSITQPRGLAMLGVSEGESVILRRPDEDPEKITVLKVAHQPEASTRSVMERNIDGWTSRWNRLFDKPDRAPSQAKEVSIPQRANKGSPTGNLLIRSCRNLLNREFWIAVSEEKPTMACERFKDSKIGRNDVLDHRVWNCRIADCGIHGLVSASLKSGAASQFALG